jgi:hypothetical protein
MNASQNRQRSFRGKEIALAKLTKQEQVKASLRIVHIFLGNIERINKDRFKILMQ